ncbi:hypothetical protein FF38_02097 [Lucilia cuprina]|uniref:Uncharacterized protein n=1 Tax=Lucilia cuprina TaxID=7375 RepID=A0A0L0C1C3_LUCCU|nr:hypothetical protein FF38_02097 [Lucilia cuprina]
MSLHDGLMIPLQKKLLNATSKESREYEDKDLNISYVTRSQPPAELAFLPSSTESSSDLVKGVKGPICILENSQTLLVFGCKFNSSNLIRKDSDLALLTASFQLRKAKEASSKLAGVGYFEAFFLAATCKRNNTDIFEFHQDLGENDSDVLTVAEDIRDLKVFSMSSKSGDKIMVAAAQPYWISFP